MRSVLKAYWKQTRSSFNRLPVWLPGNPIALGDIGVLNPDDWYKKTDLAREGVSVMTDEVGVPSDYNYSAGASVSFVTGGSVGEAANTSWLPSGHVGVLLDFRRIGAFVLKAKSVRVTRIGNLAEVEARVIDLYRQKKWKREWVIVTEVAVGGPVVVLIADQSKAKAGVNLGADAVIGEFDLGRIRGNFGVGFEQGLAAKFTTQNKSVVLWRGMYVSDGLIGSAKLKHRGEPVADGMRGRRPPDGIGAPELYLAEPEDLSEILAVPEEPNEA
ncbi:hypothetical protein ABZ568_01270 [Streptomyces olindensis]|uniref:Uncharacterized protein n=1 Tax=Streptomyces olindensis TaxID=358823 RepID=A0ABV2XMJ2_9ACTN